MEEVKVPAWISLSLTSRLVSPAKQVTLYRSQITSLLRSVRLPRPSNLTRIYSHAVSSCLSREKIKNRDKMADKSLELVYSPVNHKKSKNWQSKSIRLIQDYRWTLTVKCKSTAQKEGRLLQLWAKSSSHQIFSKPFQQHLSIMKVTSKRRQHSDW